MSVFNEDKTLIRANQGHSVSSLHQPTYKMGLDIDGLW